MNLFKDRNKATCPLCQSLDVMKQIGSGGGFVMGTGNKLVDASGERVYFKQPYFDTGLRRKFNTVEEKHKFMVKNKIVQNGDSQDRYKKDIKEHDERRKESCQK